MGGNLNMVGKKKVTKAKKVKKSKKPKVSKVSKKPKTSKKAKTAKKVEEVVEDLGTEVGKITHFFDKLGVAVIEMGKGIAVGDKIRIKGATTDFEQKIESMQIEHDKVAKAKKGDAIGMKVKDKVRPHDKVYKKK